ncbi:hypothetical protein ORD21_09050 [Deinococcus sp. ZS9-10]|uniref:DUF1772 domain-containing protein n=2 Tax=Deinococcus arenicola TaxID=2994950 RepID=A0ABU4DQM2_9DEIO|nr:hypothetical protein [Deinococcus sp. ZS9-10]
MSVSVLIIQSAAFKTASLGAMQSAGLTFFGCLTFLALLTAGWTSMQNPDKMSGNHRKMNWTEQGWNSLSENLKLHARINGRVAVCAAVGLLLLAALP